MNSNKTRLKNELLETIKNKQHKLANTSEQKIGAQKQIIIFVEIMQGQKCSKTWGWKVYLIKCAGTTAMHLGGNIYLTDNLVYAREELG